MNQLRVLLEAIKFEHTVFALPFTFLGAFLAAGGPPGWNTALWIVVAMTGARSAAMGFNRIVDRHDDGLNPRTTDRALPKGLLSLRFAAGFVIISSLIFFLAAWMLNQLAFLLSPLALAIVLLYSFTKRFTSFSHLILGLSLAIAPVGGWIAVRGAIGPEVLSVAAAVLFWVGGFDIIYSCQDYDFDRRQGRFSIPSRLGIKTALQISALFHLLMMALLVHAFIHFQLSVISWLGLSITGIGLIYEHRLVSPEDLTRVNAAFFTVNGIISVVLFLFVGLDLGWRG